MVNESRSGKERQVLVRGSKKWIQIAVNEYPEILSKEIRRDFNEQLPPDIQIDWVSPKKDKNGKYKEYREGLFKEFEIRRPKTDFWPKGGPCWDAIGIGKDNRTDKIILLVEAKGHIGEINSGRIDSKDKHPDSMRTITKTLEKTKESFKCNKDSDWNTLPYYQYMNRLAWLYSLRREGIKAYLVFLYFLNSDYKPVGIKEEWEVILRRVKNNLGYPKGDYGKFVTEVFLDVNKINGSKYGNQRQV